MRILQILQTLDLRTGGVAPAVILLSEAFIAKGHEVEIVTLDAPGSACLDSTSLKTHALGRSAPGYGYAPALLPWLRTHGSAFDRVIVNGLWQYPNFAAWRAFAGSRTPYYVIPHGMLDPWFKRTYPLKHLKKCLYWPWAEYRVLRDARAVVFTSEEERLQARESFWLYRAREKVSPLGVEEPARSQSEELFIRFPELRGKRILLFLGRLHEKKGCDLLIDAFAKIATRDASLVLVMAGPDQTGWKAELQSRAANAGIAERIIFTGMLDGSMKWNALRAAEAFVLPSHQENFGIAVVEALACGTPVLISKRVNIWREIVEDGAGFADEDDHAGTTNLLERWLDLPSTEREAMRTTARACFERRFQIERAGVSLLQILSEPADAE